MAEFHCLHYEIDNNYLTLCYRCSSLILQENGNKFHSVKPSNHEIKIEIDPKEYFHVIKKQILRKTHIMPTYSQARVEMIKYLRKLINKYKYTEKTFHLTLLYLDTILKNKNTPSESKLDLMIIACLLLAGTIRHINI